MQGSSCSGEEKRSRHIAAFHKKPHPEECAHSCAPMRPSCCLLLHEYSDRLCKAAVSSRLVNTSYNCWLFCQPRGTYPRKGLDGRVHSNQRPHTGADLVPPAAQSHRGVLEVRSKSESTGWRRRNEKMRCWMVRRRGKSSRQGAKQGRVRGYGMRSTNEEPGATQRNLKTENR